MRRTLALCTLLGIAALAGVTAPRAAARPDRSTDPQAEKQAHPRYDDGGALDWRTKWADAAALAKARRRLVFVEWGRES